MQFLPDQSPATLELSGSEKFNIILNGAVGVHQEIEVVTDNGKAFKVKARIDTDVEVEYFKHRGILNYVIRKLAKNLN